MNYDPLASQLKNYVCMLGSGGMVSLLVREQGEYPLI